MDNLPAYKVTNLPVYNISLPGSSNVKGTITFKKKGFARVAILNVQGTTTNGVDIDISFEGEPSSFATLELLAKEALMIANNTLESKYRIIGSLVANIPPSPPPPKPIPYTFSSQVVDEVTLSFLAGVDISDNYGIKTKTNTEGKFTIKGEYIPEDLLTLNFKLKDYSQLDKDIKTLDNKIITISNAIKLKPIKLSIEEDKQEALGATPEQKKLINLNIDKDFITTTSKKILDTIKVTLIPAILTLIAAFGVSKLSELKAKNKEKFEDLNATCPVDIDDLNKLIRRKNQLTKQLNNIYKSVESISKFLKIPQVVIDTSKPAVTATEVSFNIISNIPSTAVTPIPVGPTLILFKLIDF
jgi:hypothetical protein